MDAWSASTRYRVLQHVPRLRSWLGRVTVSTAGDTVTRPPGRRGQARYFATHAVRYAQRAAAVPRTIRDHDAVLVQRGLYALGPALITRPLTASTRRLVLDLDDAVFVLHPALAAKGPVARWLYGPQQTLALLRRADHVIVSTRALADMLPPWVGEPTVLPTVPDPSRYTLTEHRDEGPVIVGWAGTVGGLEFLDPLEEVFRRLAHERVANVEVVCSQPWRDWTGFQRWRLEDETSYFTGFGVGIMPLPDTPYTRAKAGFKLLQYMAAGLPVVASPVGINVELLRESRAGFLATTPREWEEALRELAGDVELRRDMGRRGRAFVEGHADLDGQARTLATLVAG
jgi:hypothetical protein